ncbi:hypothetical protein BZA05DRAFT_414119 [Tricharina praecox]|uniref:uncharacterized protein n=1 Tax=Tricharina praecox TaxID=43433 RepID=UPI002220281F|nr:uncharacterized protein BZA05DRAFT_414119 [Tricharina praecox]KAI5840351.1 hypothetical protein BZA05DRAFT_414119 [Tricharina praecox]
MAVGSPTTGDDDVLLRADNNRLRAENHRLSLENTRLVRESWLAAECERLTAEITRLTSGGTRPVLPPPTPPMPPPPAPTPGVYTGKGKVGVIDVRQLEALSEEAKVRLDTLLRNGHAAVAAVYWDARTGAWISSFQTVCRDIICSLSAIGIDLVAPTFRDTDYDGHFHDWIGSSAPGRSANDKFMSCLAMMSTIGQDWRGIGIFEREVVFTLRELIVYRGIKDLI